LVGVCSYLLVSFWFTRIAANQSSISAFLTNRVGDCFLTIGMFAILWSFGKNKKMLKVYLERKENKIPLIQPYKQVKNIIIPLVIMLWLLT
jgi:NADH:ubiquinone oxidoreductase subunit 5 (subunit L)/multisubunit Na+/H+ antiporter MnhA subunit